MLSKIAVFFVLCGFGFWGYGIHADPQYSPIAGWVAWTVMCLSLGISRVYSKEPATLWFVFALGDIIMIALTLYLGGYNWAFEKNAMLLELGGVSLVFSLIFGKKYPRLSEALGGIPLVLGYYIQAQEWLHAEMISRGVIGAAISGVIASMLFGIHSQKKTGSFGISNLLAFVGVTIFTTTLVMAKYFL